MDNQQIAHDLAIAKLHGSNLETEELIKTYRQYKEEILSVLNSEPSQVKPAKITRGFI